MIENFHDKHTRALFELVKCHRKWRKFELVALRKLSMLHAAKELKDLRSPPGNRLESLSGNRSGQHSIRINSQYRVCFTWENGNAFRVEITDYHD
ncbi:MAG TPA: plasmid maintenance system killer protein [Rhodospirillales bacterium]|nr:plasmid maintenance system killer protein [Rhodospirillales bacterium]